MGNGWGYAIQFRFSDGHNTGLFSYDLLMQLASKLTIKNNNLNLEVNHFLMILISPTHHLARPSQIINNNHNRKPNKERLTSRIPGVKKSGNVLPRASLINSRD